MDGETDMWKERNQGMLDWLRKQKKDELIEIIIRLELLSKR